MPITSNYVFQLKIHWAKGREYAIRKVQANKEGLKFLPLQGFLTNFTSKWMFTTMNIQVAPEDIAVGERFFYTHHMKKVSHHYVCRHAI
jgi:hypothetical protein